MFRLHQCLVHLEGKLSEGDKYKGAFFMAGRQRSFCHMNSLQRKNFATACVLKTPLKLAETKSTNF